MYILVLSLKKKWYKMIESGIKKEEYREIKPFWMRRIFDCPRGLSTCMELTSNCSNCIRLLPLRPRSFTHVRFRYGYTSKTMTFKIGSIAIGTGKLEWGAPKENVIIISIGDRVE